MDLLTQRPRTHYPTEVTALEHGISDRLFEQAVARIRIHIAIKSQRPYQPQTLPPHLFQQLQKDPVHLFVRQVLEQNTQYSG